MYEIPLSADELVESLLNLPDEFNLCLLDSCGIFHLNSHLLVAGISPSEIIEINDPDYTRTLQILDEKLSAPHLGGIFTISYDFGLKLHKIQTRHQNLTEPDIFLALFDVLIIHDYNTNESYLTGNEKKFKEIATLLRSASAPTVLEPREKAHIQSNFTHPDYLSAIEKVQEFIRSGDTYQTNLTQQIKARLPENLSPEMIFRNLRKSHPAPFSSFIRRKGDVVVSASPERFFRVESKGSKMELTVDCDSRTLTSDSRLITVSPIKGTRPRGKSLLEDTNLKNELLNSEKDRAENVMIVDLLRNDLGRICEFGSVRVEKLYDLEEHPTLFHLVSTVSGKLRANLNFSDILLATFPCGSITGAPKIRTMQIIDEIETASRGLSMGAIGMGIGEQGLPTGEFIQTTFDSRLSIRASFDLSVAIRTMVVRGKEAIFNVGGGIVIDSLPENEYEETLIKARALLKAIKAEEQDLFSLIR